MVALVCSTVRGTGSAHIHTHSAHATHSPHDPQRGVPLQVHAQEVSPAGRARQGQLQLPGLRDARLLAHTPGTTCTTYTCIPATDRQSVPGKADIHNYNMARWCETW
jgi:hypothetical protein